MPSRAEPGISAERLMEIESAGGLKPSWSLNDYRGELESPLAKVWVWPEGEGFVLYRPDGVEAWITQTAVAHKGAGNGTKLLASFMEAMRAEGFKSIGLEVSRGNAPAVRLYEKCAFSKIGERKSYYRNGDDAIVMRRALK